MEGGLSLADPAGVGPPLNYYCAVTARKTRSALTAAVASDRSPNDSGALQIATRARSGRVNGWDDEFWWYHRRHRGDLASAVRSRKSADARKCTARYNFSGV